MGKLSSSLDRAETDPAPDELGIRMFRRRGMPPLRVRCRRSAYVGLDGDGRPDLWIALWDMSDGRQVLSWSGPGHDGVDVHAVIVATLVEAADCLEAECGALVAAAPRGRSGPRSGGKSRRTSRRNHGAGEAQEALFRAAFHADAVRRFRILAGEFLAALTEVSAAHPIHKGDRDDVARRYL